MDTYQIWSLVVSIVVGVSIMAQGFFSCILIRYTKYQKTVNTRGVLLHEMAINFTFITEIFKTQDELKDMPPCEEKTAMMKRSMDTAEEISARNAEIWKKLDKLSIF